MVDNQKDMGDIGVEVGQNTQMNDVDNEGKTMVYIVLGYS